MLYPVFNMVFDIRRGQHLALNASVALLYSLQKSGLENLGHLPQLKGSSGNRWFQDMEEEPELESVGNLREEGWVSL